MKHEPLLLLLLLTGCSTVPVPTTPAESAQPAPQPVETTDVSSLLDFRYSWPAAASADASLRAYLVDDRMRSQTEALEHAATDEASVANFNAPFHQHQFWRQWTLAGETAQLISLRSQTDFYTGGAHPNHASGALLWDRSAHRQVAFAQLFNPGTAFEAALRPEFCKLLDAERLKRRQGAKLEGEYGECPPFSDLTLVPMDSDGDARFDSVEIIADPYVAGAYVEGAYEIGVHVPPALLAAVRPEYRPSFEPQRQ